MELIIGHFESATGGEKSPLWGEENRNYNPGGDLCFHSR